MKNKFVSTDKRVILKKDIDSIREKYGDGYYVFTTDIKYTDDSIFIYRDNMNLFVLLMSLLNSTFDEVCLHDLIENNIWKKLIELLKQFYNFNNYNDFIELLKKTANENNTTEKLKLFLRTFEEIQNDTVNFILKTNPNCKWTREEILKNIEIEANSLEDEFNNKDKYKTLYYNLINWLEIQISNKELIYFCGI